MSSVFFNPWMLSALAAVAIPLIIEWLFRRRKRQVELPTLRYLLNNEEQEKVRRQDRILLILRTVAIFLLVMALTRPLIQRGWIKSGRQRQVVILLDGTASMNQQVDVTTAFGRAQKKAAAVVRGLPSGTTVTVGYVGERAVEAVEPTTDLHTAAARIDALRAGSGDAPMNEGLDWVKEYMDHNKVAEAEVYLFSDFQKQTWQPQRKQELVGRSLADLSRRCEIFMIDCGGEPQFNFIMSGLRPEEYVISANVPVKFIATVEARGKVPEDKSATVTFVVDGVKKDVRQVHPGNNPVNLTFEYRFPGPGEYLVQAELEGDEHRIDNHRYYLCSVPESIKVLLLDEQADSPTADSRFLARAIAPPSRPGMEKVSFFSANVIQPAQIAFENLDSYPVVVLTATRTLTDQIATKLERYVSDGGSLWVFMGPGINLYDYNKLLFKDGKGLLPSRLATVKSATSQPGGAELLPRFGDSAHPAFAQLAGEAGDKDAGVLQFMSVDKPPAGGRVVLSFSDGSPAILEKSFGQGKVLLSATTAGVEWNYLPALVEYPILVQEMLRYLVGNPDRSVNLQVGDRFEQPVYVTSQHLLLRCPDGKKVRLTPVKRSDREDVRMVSFDGTNQQGLYEVEAIEEVLPRRRFVANMSEKEGDLTRLHESEFKDAFGSSRWSWIKPETAVEEMAAKLHTVIELAPALFWGLVGLLAVESFLAWRFGRRRGEVTS